MNVALSEALVLAERAGVDRKTAYEVFASGAGGAPFVQYKRAAYEDPDGAPVAFSLDLVAKDLDLITGLGERVQAPDAPGADVAPRSSASAIADGFGDRDLSAIAVFLRGERCLMAAHIVKLAADLDLRTPVEFDGPEQGLRRRRRRRRTGRRRCRWGSALARLDAGGHVEAHVHSFEESIYVMEGR